MGGQFSASELVCDRLSAVEALRIFGKLLLTARPSTVVDGKQYLRRVSVQRPIASNPSRESLTCWPFALLLGLRIQIWIL